MKTVVSCLLMILMIMACTPSEKSATPKNTDFSNRTANLNTADSLQSGQSYLSVYSQIYSFSENEQHDLTVTVSLRNVSETESVFIGRADYFDTKGEVIKKYLDQTIVIKPMETLEIVIEENDKSGGTGANFLFEWLAPKNCPEPLFEAVMISTKGQQGLSFTTRSQRIL